MNFYDIEFVKGFIRMCDDGWQQGWHERNGGNLSYRLSEKDVEEAKEYFKEDDKWQSIGASVPDLANEYFMVTGSGKFFRNVILKPEDSTCIIKVDETGEKYKIVWGLVNGGRPTSELPSHLMNQPVKIEKDQWFSAIVSVSNENGDAKIMTSYKNGREMSYINNGSGWTQLKNYVGRIKVYTKLENKVENPTIEVPTTEAPTTAEVTTTLKPTTEVTTTAEVTTTSEPTTEVTTTLEPTTEKQTETTVTVEPTTEILTTENTTSETTVENQTTDETTSEKESTTTFGQVVTKENEPTTNGKTTTRVDGVNKKSLKQTKILKVKKLKNRKVRITFKKVSKAKIYRIQYSTDRKFKKNVRTKRTGKTTYLLRKLRVRKRYYVRVRAIVGKVH